MIPRIMHQFFFADKKLKKPPAAWHKYSIQAKKLHRTWEYMLWDRQSMEALVQAHYPYLAEYFANEVITVIKTDIGRYLVLKHYGGWYFDFDYELIKPLDSFNNNELILPLERSFETQDECNQIGNAILASIPQHWFWDLVLDQLPPPSFFNQALSHDDILHNTGPNRLTYLYENLSKPLQAKIVVPPRVNFHTPIPIMMSAQEHRTIQETPEVYGTHHTHSSWRDDDLHKNLRRRKFAATPFLRPMLAQWVKIKSKFKG